MEHLFFIPNDYDGPKIVMKASVLDATFASSPADFEPIEPMTPWLGFGHDEKPLASFQEYCPSSDWRLTKIWDGDLRQSHESLRTLLPTQISERVAAVLQSWLYFGLLEAFLGKKVKSSYMTMQRVEASTILYTRNLSACLQARVFELRMSDDTTKQRLNSQIQHDLSLTHDWIARFVAWSVEPFRTKMEANYPGFIESIGSATPAIVRLAEALECTMIHAIPHLSNMGPRDWHYPYFVTERRNKKLLELGWCPFVIRLLEDTTIQSLLDWTLSRGEKRTLKEHEHCNPSECIRNNIDEWSYVQQHLTTDCDCGKLKPQMDAIPAVLDSNFIPVVHVEGEDGNVTVEVSGEDLESPGNYVAISHVWVDGLGGSTETGLYQCQADRLQVLASQLLQVEKATFWMDTLCIPQIVKYRKSAILQMRKVYQNAAAVLVIDKSIQRCLSSASTEEILFAIYTSSWVQRMWTYQEAVLAGRLVFLLQDGLWEYKIDTHPWMRPTVAVVWRCLAANLFRLRTDRNAISIGHVYTALRWRNTSRREDELLVVSTLLRVESIQLMNADRDERARMIWLALKDIPWDMPLLDGPKLSIPGFRWAPSTLMHQSKLKPDTQSAGRKSQCTPEGLVGDYMIISLGRALRGSRGINGIVRSGKDSIFNVYVHGDETPTSWKDSSNCVLRLYCNETWPEGPQTKPFDTLLFSRKEKPESGHWLPAVALLRHKPEDGTHLVGSEVGELLFCDYVGRLLVERLQIDEVANEQESIMSAGSQGTFINAAGVWSVERLCIR